ncbi:PH domain-containing protein [Bdellovibrio sp. NC01]|uniref:PH domain-containing protein n=1 Tax=Bdellovibrio sp. NC01 TaxID=2220073 RepID=UPI00115C3390|nr:PH domain-containing protein [Bdellovibrio sp. NC01]QDK38452.1 hypothetical protein DOE51_13135 [Bdellovibrio sp. NC01]
MFKLRENEEIKFTAKFHWSDYIVTGFWALLFTPAVMVSIFGNAKNFSTWPLLLIGYGPLIYKVLKNKSRKYIITNQRLYVESGILSRTSTDIPLNKINDIALTQNFIERIFNVGGLKVLTGNDKGTLINGIVEPNGFQEILSRHCNAKAI